MATDPKPTPADHPRSHRERGVRLFSYPKVIFMFPTLVVALICAIGMWATGNNTADPLKQPAAAEAQIGGDAPVATNAYQRFKTPANLFGVLFLGVFAFNLMVMALDFPRFTIIAGILFGLFGIFFFLWVGTYFEVDLLSWSRGALGFVYVEANSGFYFMVVLIMLGLYGLVYVTRYLDYWEIRANEILHHHGPLSDLERFPTINLKFSKEIPDILEFMFLGSGRIVLTIPNVPRAIVLDNVLFINSAEQSLKGLMSGLEVRMSEQRGEDSGV